MASKTSAKRGAAIITLIAALAGPGAASAASSKNSGTVTTSVTVTDTGVVASWYEDASWAES